MMNHTYDQQDMGVMAQILEAERKTRCRVRSLCFAVLLLSMACLMSIIVLVAFTFANDTNGSLESGLVAKAQILVPLSGMMVMSFTGWYACQNCINSIDRSLYAARAKRHRLFEAFVRDMQCATKEKRSMLIELVGSVIA